MKQSIKTASHVVCTDYDVFKRFKANTSSGHVKKTYYTEPKPATWRH
jgi:hypothetical protein